MKIPQIIPVTDLRQDAATVLKQLQDSTEPLVITQRGRAIAVLQSVEAYEQAEHERELLRMLADGEKAISADDGVPLGTVLKEADDLLEDRDD